MPKRLGFGGAPPKPRRPLSGGGAVSPIAVHHSTVETDIDNSVYLQHPMRRLRPGTRR
ncbi:hypothetical protein [Variovorax sp. WS11]|uniref:hypothetical protein n=1 Tax=Variovorax sp. WS11 TaxID=1105204 RepID=UPI0013DB8A6D|nr:hypothetical protein [Variovorax sp. WS11]NDZ13597.1 hypothetical protein [Variovorax sp. WS11]